MSGSEDAVGRSEKVPITARILLSQSLSARRAAVIIAVSGYGHEDDLRRSRDAGIDHHLLKPVDYDALVALMDRAERQLHERSGSGR